MQSGGGARERRQWLRSGAAAVAAVDASRSPRQCSKQPWTLTLHRGGSRDEQARHSRSCGQKFVSVLLARLRLMALPHCDTKSQDGDATVRMRDMPQRPQHTAQERGKPSIACPPLLLHHAVCRKISGCVCEAPAGVTAAAVSTALTTSHRPTKAPLQPITRLKRGPAGAARSQPARRCRLLPRLLPCGARPPAAPVPRHLAAAAARVAGRAVPGAAAGGGAPWQRLASASQPVAAARAAGGRGGRAVGPAPPAGPRACLPAPLPALLLLDEPQVSPAEWEWE